MLLLNLFLVNFYIFTSESLKEIPSGLLNKNLITTMQKVLCSTDSYMIHLLATKRQDFDEIGELIQFLNRDCSFKTVQLSEVSDTRISRPLQFHSVVTVLMVNSRKQFNYYIQTVTRNEGGNKNNKFLVVLKFEYELSLVVKIFERFIEKYFFNIVIILYAEPEVSILTYNPFMGTIFSVNDTVFFRNKGKNDIFVHNQDDLRGRNLVVSMYEQNDRAVLKKNGRPGYAGVDGLIADLLEERYL